MYCSVIECVVGVIQYRNEHGNNHFPDISQKYGLCMLKDIWKFQFCYEDKRPFTTFKCDAQKRNSTLSFIIYGVTIDDDNNENEQNYLLLFFVLYCRKNFVVFNA